ncbi:MAG: hypothetical protein ACJ76W_01540 [Chloroflexota bacterium]
MIAAGSYGTDDETPGAGGRDGDRDEDKPGQGSGTYDAAADSVPASLDDATAKLASTSKNLDAAAAQPTDLDAQVKQLSDQVATQTAEPTGVKPGTTRR